MILTDGTTSITINYADEKLVPTIEKTSARTAGGKIRATTGGERFKLDVRCRVTQAQFRTLYSLLTNNAANYYYTPERDYDTLYPDFSFPISVDITNHKIEWENGTVIYINFTVEATGYV